MGCGDCCGHAAPPSATSGPGGALPAGNDVGNLLQWDGTAWIPVVVPTSEGQIIAWDADTSQWIAEGAPTADGQILIWNSALEQWVASGGTDGPLDIMAPSEIAAGWRASDGAILSGNTTLSQWSDMSGHGQHLVQFTVANQPQLRPTTGPNNTPSILFDGVNDTLSATLLDRQAPGTQVTFYWAVLRQVSFTAADRFWSSEGASRLAFTQALTAGTPNVTQMDVTEVNANSGLPINTYGRVEVSFTNSTADYIKCIGTTVTGANAGNVDPLNSFRLGGDAAGGTFSNIEVCELWVFNVVPSAAQKIRLDAYVTARYGAGLV